MNKFRRLVNQIDLYNAHYEKLELQLFDTVYMLNDKRWAKEAEFRRAVERRQADILAQMQSLLSAHTMRMKYILIKKHYG